MLKNKKEKRWGSSGEIPKSEMAKEVFKVGGKVLLFASIIPIIHTLIFIFAILLPEIDGGISFNSIYMKTHLSLLIADWAFIVIPFVIPAMIGKRLLFSEKNRWKIRFVPLMTGVLCFTIGTAFALWYFFGVLL